MTKEEAIDNVRSFIGQLTAECQESIHTLIPELAESEDERIRKNLIELLLDTPAQDIISHNLELSKVLAYLEKQKEQKPIFKKGDKVIWDDEEFNILDVNETEYNVGGYRVPFSRQNELHPIWQKSAEWSEEDEEMLNSCISSIEEAKENRYAYKETDGDTSYDHEIAWLKSLRNRVGKEFLQPHWKPSEEQMEALKDAFRKDGCNEYRKVINSLYCDLQKLL